MTVHQLRAPRMSAAQRREQLLDVAVDVLSVEGAQSLTVDAVAAKAGVHRQVIYRHFDNAEQLLDAAIDRHLTLVSTDTLATLQDVVGLEARLRAAVTVWMNHFAASPGVLSAALVQPTITEGSRQRRRAQNRASVSFLVNEFTAAGLSQTDAEVAAAVLLRGLGGVVELWRAKRISRRMAIDKWVVIALGIVSALSTPES